MAVYENEEQSQRIYTLGHEQPANDLGEIWAQNAPAGTCFDFKFPILTLTVNPAEGASEGTTAER